MGDELRAYFEDVLVLERRLRAPLDRRLEAQRSAAYGDVARILATVRGLADAHIARLEHRLHAGGSTTTAADGGARTSDAASHLRDDYGALSLASISYVMLQAAAAAAHDDAAASLAEQHREDYAPLMLDIAATIGDVVAEEMEAEHLAVNPASAAS